MLSFSGGLLVGAILAGRGGEDGLGRGRGRVGGRVRRGRGESANSAIETSIGLMTICCCDFYLQSPPVSYKLS